MSSLLLGGYLRANGSSCTVVHLQSKVQHLSYAIEIQGFPSGTLHQMRRLPMKQPEGYLAIYLITGIPLLSCLDWRFDRLGLSSRITLLRAAFEFPGI